MGADCGTDEIRFPYDGTCIAHAPVGDAAAAQRAVDAAVAVRDEVGRLPSHVRRTVLREAHRVLSARRDDVETLLVLETGKPLVDCRVEVDRTLLTLKSAAEEVARLHGETVPLDLLPSGEGLLGFWVRKPIGVVVGIAGSTTRSCSPRTRSRPRSPRAARSSSSRRRRRRSPRSGWFTRSARRSPRPVRRVPPCNWSRASRGRRRPDDRPSRRGGVFTGSAAVGHQIAKDAAPTKVLLELGSNAALIVAADADLDAAADAIARGGYYASGKRASACSASWSSRRSENTSCQPEARMAGIVVGDPRPRDAGFSPHRSALDRTGPALGRPGRPGGATLACGGRTVGDVVEPTVLLDVPEGQPVWDEEVFGPVVAVRSVPDLSTAYDVVNASRYGLHASVFTASLEDAFDAVDRIEAGGVVVNEVPGFRQRHALRRSQGLGVGREGPRFAIEELTVTRMAIIRTQTRKHA